MSGTYQFVHPASQPEQEKKDDRPTDRTSEGVINSWLLHETLDCCSPGVQLKRVVFSFHNVPAAGQGIWKSEESKESVLSAKEIVYTFNGGAVKHKRNRIETAKFDCCSKSFLVYFYRCLVRTIHKGCEFVRKYVIIILIITTGTSR